MSLGEGESNMISRLKGGGKRNSSFIAEVKETVTKKGANTEAVNEETENSHIVCFDQESCNQHMYHKCFLELLVNHNFMVYPYCRKALTIDSSKNSLVRYSPIWNRPMWDRYI